jgi:hypothetical protein
LLTFFDDKYAKRPIWWAILALIPIVNICWIVMGVIVWMDISKARGKEAWLGVLMIVPIANLVVPGYLAWSK